MTQVEPRTYAAPALRTKRVPDPDKVLQRLDAENSDATDTELLELFLKAASAAEKKAALLYYVHNRRQPIKRYARVMEPIEPEQYLEQAEARRIDRQVKIAKIRRAAPAITKIAILELEMPNGKKLRDCTFREVAKFGIGFTRLSKMGKPNELVSILSASVVQRALQ